MTNFYQTYIKLDISPRDGRGIRKVLTSSKPQLNILLEGKKG